VTAFSPSEPALVVSARARTEPRCDPASVLEQGVLASAGEGRRRAARHVGDHVAARAERGHELVVEGADELAQITLGDEVQLYAPGV
jgi:hypothetical protein